MRRGIAPDRARRMRRRIGEAARPQGHDAARSRLHAFFVLSAPCSHRPILPLLSLIWALRSIAELTGKCPTTRLESTRDGAVLMGAVGEGESGFSACDCATFPQIFLHSTYTGKNRGFLLLFFKSLVESEDLERAKGFEPSTPTLAILKFPCATTRYYTIYTYIQRLTEMHFRRTIRFPPSKRPFLLTYCLLLV